jgi:hypothetical protein
MSKPRIFVSVPTWDKDRSLLVTTSGAEYTMATLYNPEGGPVQNMAALAQEWIEDVDGLEDDDILGFLHDDVVLLSLDWPEKVRAMFRYFPRVGLVGFGGASGLGHPDIYKVPYELNQLQRYGFASAMTDWEVHGSELIEGGAMFPAAVVDGFSMFFRVSAYRAIGGWEQCLADGLPFHMYDAWASCALLEKGWLTAVAGVRCTHFGGRTSTTPEYQEWCRKNGYRDGQDLFDRAHRTFYERFRSVLPVHFYSQFPQIRQPQGIFNGIRCTGEDISISTTSGTPEPSTADGADQRDEEAPRFSGPDAQPSG